MRRRLAKGIGRRSRMYVLPFALLCVRVEGDRQRGMVKERRFLFGAVNTTLEDSPVEEKSLLGPDKKVVKKKVEVKERKKCWLWKGQIDLFCERRKGRVNEWR